jgi:hypothetical protein
MNKILNLFPSLSSIPHYADLHLHTVPGTLQLEAQAQKLITGNFDPGRLRDFITEVHRWGGSMRNVNKVLNNAKRETFILAFNNLMASPTQIESALKAVLTINGLGPSYGSKHLRFLCPQYCPILDNTIWECFRYPWNAEGYRLLHQDVMQVARTLEKNQINNPVIRSGFKWYAADVDLAIFAFLQNQARKTGWV